MCIHRFHCVTDFSTLRKGDRVIVGDQPDARIANILFIDAVDANHPSQRHYTFPKGYIRFYRERRYFDLATSRLRSQRKYLRLAPKKAYIFVPTDGVELLFARTEEKRKVEHWLKDAGQGDRIALAQLCAELVAPHLQKSIGGEDRMDQVLVACLEVAGLSQLRDLNAMLGAGQQNTESHALAA